MGEGGGGNTIFLSAFFLSLCLVLLLYSCIVLMHRWMCLCVFLLQEGDGEMDITSLSGAWASSCPVDLLLR